MRAIVTRRGLLWRPALVGAGLLALGGCASGLGVAFAGANAVSYATSGKLLADHAMSAATQQNCSIRHDIEGQGYCVPVAAEGPSDAGLRCYRSIAEVTCYRGEDPNETSTRQIR